MGGVGPAPVPPWRSMRSRPARAHAGSAAAAALAVTHESRPCPDRAAGWPTAHPQHRRTGGWHCRPPPPAAPRCRLQPQGREQGRGQHWRLSHHTCSRAQVDGHPWVAGSSRVWPPPRRAHLQHRAARPRRARRGRRRRAPTHLGGPAPAPLSLSESCPELREELEQGGDMVRVSEAAGVSPPLPPTATKKTAAARRGMSSASDCVATSRRSKVRPTTAQASVAARRPPSSCRAGAAAGRQARGSQSNSQR